MGPCMVQLRSLSKWPELFPSLTVQPQDDGLLPKRNPSHAACMSSEAPLSLSSVCSEYLFTALTPSSPPVMEKGTLSFTRLQDLRWHPGGYRTAGYPNTVPDACLSRVSKLVSPQEPQMSGDPTGHVGLSHGPGDRCGRKRKEGFSKCPH